MNLADAPTAAGSSDASRAAPSRHSRNWPAGHLTGYATLARLREAALKADAGDLQGAAALWDQVASDSSADPLLRDLASLLWAQHLIDSGDPALLEARLKALAAPDNSWRSLAEEQLALLDLRRGKATRRRPRCGTWRRIPRRRVASAGARTPC